MAQSEPPTSVESPFGPPVHGPILERIRAKLLFLPTSVAFAFLLLRPGWRLRPREIWIGDSHAMTYNRDIVNSLFIRAPEGQFILRAGARLMFSLGRKGFPPAIARTAALVARTRRRGRLIPFFMCGEIDVRAHLVKHGDDYTFVREYVERCAVLADQLGATTFYVAVPPPPVDLFAEECWYPITGTPAERAVAHRRLREELRLAVAATDGARLFDATDDLANAEGIMARDRTVDGCHTNLEMVAKIRQRVRAELYG